MDYTFLAGLVFCIIVVVYLIYDRVRLLKEIQTLKQTKPRTLTTQRSILKGQLAEQVFPLLHDRCPFSLSDMRFLGQPVDYIVFSGHGEGHVKEIVFVEIKTGKSKLSGIQNSIKNAVEEKKVRWQTVHIE